MPLTKAKGNMYGLVTHTHSHLGGECPHKCGYCYVQAMEKRFGRGRYAGELRLIEAELSVNYGRGKKIFVEHCNDLFSWGVDDRGISLVLAHCRQYPENEYVFQTKNPGRILAGFWFDPGNFPENTTIGCTIESDVHWHPACGNTPSMQERSEAMWQIKLKGFKTFITVEPIIKFDLGKFVNLLCHANPDFINIGADSKGGKLPEPNKDEILKLVRDLRFRGWTVNLKPNLERIVGKENMEVNP